MEIYFALLMLLGIEVLLKYGITPKKVHIMFFNRCIFSDSMVRLYENSILIFDFMLLLVLAVCRDISVGSDYKTYMTIFSGMTSDALNDVSSNYFWFNGEIGFALIGTLIGNIFGDPFLIVCVCYVMILGGVYLFIKKYSDNALLSTFLFLTFSFYNMSYNILRQYIAAVILLKTIDYINKDFKRFFMFVLLAAFFHKSAVIFLFVYPIFKYIKDVRVGVLFFVSFMAGIAVMPTSILSFLGDVLDYGGYVSDKESGGLANIIVMAIIFMLFLTFTKIMQSKDPHGKIWLIFAAIAFSISMFSVQIHSFNRLLLYFLMPAIVSIVNFIHAVLNISSVKYGEVLTLVIFSIYYTSLLLYTSVYQTVPYSSKILGI